MKKYLCVFLLAALLIGCKDIWHPEGPTNTSSNANNDNNNNPEGEEETIPGIPSGVQATAVSTSEIMVFWTAVDGANSYIVFYGTEPAGSSQYGGTASGLSFTLTGLQPGTTYYSTVMAGNGAGWSAKSSAVGGTTTALAAPTGLSATAQSSEGITVSWNAVSGAASYKIYRSGSVVGLSDTAAYTDTGLTASTTYSYTVSAVSGGGTEGAQSPAVSGTTSAPSSDPLPGTPGGVGTTVLSSAGIRVSWNTVSGANSYMAYYGTEAAGSSQYGGTASGLSLTVTGLQPGTTYYFTVKAGNNAGWSEGSAPVSGTTAALAAPTGLSATAQSSSGLAVSWGAVAGAASYKIYRASSSTGSFVSIGTSSTTSYTDTELTAGTTYWYKVSAVNGTEGAQSAVVSGTTTALAAPTGVSVTVQSSSGLTVSWSAVTGASSYKIYRANSSSGSFTSIGTSSTTPYTDTGLTAGTSYWYKVSAVNGTEGAQSSAVNGTTSAPISDPLPGIPGGVGTTVLSFTEIRVSWSTVSGADSYMVYYGTETAGSSQYGGTASGLSLTITGLQPGTIYYFTVKAGNSAGWSGGSSPVSGTTTAVAAPSGISATAQSSSGIAVSWSAVTGASSYKIYRAISSSGPFTGSVGTSSTTTYTDTGLTANTTYWYKVSAVNGTEGAQSAAVSGTTNDIILASPTGVSATAQSTSGIALSWGAVSGAASYKIYRLNNSTGTFTNIGTSSTTSYSDTGLAAGTMYYYAVSAVTSGGTEGAQSGAVSGITILATPTGVSATAQSTSVIAISWSTVSGASSYKIYQSSSSTGPFTIIGTSSATSYTDTGLPANTTYWYKVSAVTSGGTEGAQSVAVSGTTASPPPPPPDSDALLFVGASANAESGVTNLSGALAWIKTTAAANTTYTIRLNKDVSFEPYILDSTAVNNKSGVTIVLRGNNIERKINLNSKGALFTVNTGVTITLDDRITLVGRNSNTTSLIRVEGGTLVMNDGAKITGNTVIPTTTTAWGGGVYVNSGIFAMNGGEISGNTASASSGSVSIWANDTSLGGGVYVASGILTMSGGEISGNAATSYCRYPVSNGGGVYVASGTLTMSGGKISGNTISSSTSVSNSSNSSYSYGGGVYVASGTLTMSGGEISGNTATSSSRYAVSGGGGVCVESGTFIMSGGEISSNTVSSSASSSIWSAYSYGGGVYVQDSGQINHFTKTSTGGIIYGSNATATLKNNAGGNGDSVYVYTGSKRNSTAGSSVALDSDISGSAGGWE